MENLLSKNINFWRIFGISSVIGLSYLSLKNYGYSCGQTGPGFEYMGTWTCEDKYHWTNELLYVLCPGIYFSAFLTIFFMDSYSIGKRMKHFFILVAIYCCTYLPTQITFGFSTLFIGTLTPFFILVLIPEKLQTNPYKLMLAGFITGAFGLFLAYMFGDPTSSEKEGITYLLATIPWQITIGSMLIIGNYRKFVANT